VLEAAPGDLEAQWVLALVAIDRGHALEALRRLDAALASAPDHLGLQLARGRAQAATGRRADAVVTFKRAAAAHPASADPWVELASLAGAGRREDEALGHLATALELEPAHPDANVQLANILRSRGRVDEAVQHYRRAIATAPDHADALQQLGGVMHQRGQLDEARRLLTAALQVEPGLLSASYTLGLVCADQRRWQEAAELLRSYTAAHPKDANAHYWLGNASMALGLSFQADKAYQAAVRIEPGLVAARWGAAMAQLPAVAQSTAEQDAAVENFRRELTKLKAWFRSHADAEGQRAVGAQQPFYLAYIPRNHRLTLAEYGGLCTSLMSAWARKVGVPKPAGAGSAKCRVGIVSSHVHTHSVWNAIIRGWIEHLDPSKFELHVFHTGGGRDAETEWAKRRVARMVEGLGDWPVWAKAISDARCDVLLYPEIGMDSTTTRLASLRLAPAQGASWGHPLTSGLPTIDAYLSAEAFEPDGAQEHYTEKLIALPRLGCCYRPYGVQASTPDLAAWRISPDDTLIVCAGTPFKYAPRDDRLLVEIARRCPSAKLVFFKAQPERLAELFEVRLRKSFEAAGLPFDASVRFIPWQSQPRFFGLLDRAAVYLDSVGFSGFNTTMQAVERGTPIVAWEGEFMRGRFASAILRQAGLGEWVADTDERFVSLVEQLCSDRSLRDSVRRRIASARKALFDDRAVVAALAEQLVALRDASA